MTASIIPAQRDDYGYWIGPKSSCCRAPIVYFRKDRHLGAKYVTWTGIPAEVELRCNRCHSELHAGVKE